LPRGIGVQDAGERPGQHVLLRGVEPVEKQVADSAQVRGGRVGDDLETAWRDGDVGLPDVGVTRAALETCTSTS
jgi:hypothetical protein